MELPILKALLIEKQVFKPFNSLALFWGDYAGKYFSLVFFGALQVFLLPCCIKGEKNG